MPRAVIATGAADLMLPMRELAARLAELIRTRDKIAPLIAEAQGTTTAEESEEKALQQLLDLLRRRSGHDFAKYKRSTVLRRLVRRMHLNHSPTILAYVDCLAENVKEI